MKITIQGPQGTRKTLLAQAIQKMLTFAGKTSVIIEEDDGVRPIKGHFDVVIRTMNLPDKFITTGKMLKPTDLKYSYKCVGGGGGKK